MQTEIYINGTKIDLTEDLPISLNYAIADIRDPEKRNTSYSKTISIPGTKTNNKLFSHIFKIDSDINNSTSTNFNPDYNPNLKASCLVYNNKELVFNGHARLMSIEILDRYRIKYQISLFGDLANIFLDIGVANITELDYSAYDHVYNITNISNSWTAGIGYYYPMIDYGKNNLKDWKTTHFYPAIYLYELIDKIFAYAGYTYECAEFSTQQFKNIIIPFNSDGLRLPESVVANRYVKANKNTTSDYIFGTNSIVINFNNEILDPGSNYNPVTFQYTAPANGTYNIEGDITCQLRYEPSVFAYIWTPPSINCTIEFFKIETSGNQIQVFSANVINGTPLMPVQDTAVNPGDLSAAFQYTVNQTVYLLAGEKLTAKIRPFGYSTNYGGLYFDTPISGLGSQNVIAGDLYYRITNASNLYVKFKNEELQQGETVLMNGVIPKDIKMRDVLVSVFNAFNLYIQPSETISRHLIINTRNDFYTNEYVDWTNKIDLSKTIEIQPMAALEARRYIFKYDDDTDFYNDSYKKVYGKNYSERWVDIENDFLKGNKETKLIFASTPSVGQSWTSRVIPSIVKVDQNGNKSIKSSKIRLLFKPTAGVLDCDLWSYDTLGNTSYFSQYPYAGHLDDPYNSTVDLNFGVPNEIYWSGNIFYTNNNLYNKYHRKFITEITDKNSKIVTAEFYLNPSDISALDFRKKVLIQNNYYLINKVIDYNPQARTTTKVELLKIKNGINFISSTGTVRDGLGEPFGIDEGFPPSARYSTGDSNNNGNVVIGNNFVHPLAESTIVSGYNNVVGANCRMISILGSSGCVVSSGLENVSLINTSGVTVTSSNSSYVNGVNVSSFGNGSYTPTLTAVSNVDTVTLISAYYYRSGSIVSVFGLVNLNATTASTLTYFRMSLPISSEFTTQTQLSGTAGGNHTFAAIVSNEATNDALFGITPNSSSATAYTFNFSYIIL